MQVVAVHDDQPLDVSGVPFKQVAVHDRVVVVVLVAVVVMAVVVVVVAVVVVVVVLHGQSDSGCSCM